MNRKLSILFATLLLSAFANYTYATHVRAGEVLAERISCTSWRYNIRIVMYVDTEGVEPGLGTISYGDGSFEELDFRQGGSTPNEREDLGDNIEKVVYIRDHTFPGPGTYRISFREENRNADIVNMDNSVNTPFYVESVIIMDPSLGCDNTPVLQNPPVDKGCIGVSFLHNPGAVDIDGDSLSYEFTIPKQDADQEVLNYQFPDNYDIANYNAQNEEGTGSATFTINPTTGTVTWDAPGGEGEYNFAFRIVQWKKIGGRWEQVGYVVRDMQVRIEDCDNEKPELILPNDTCVVAGTLLEAEIMAIDPDGDEVEISSTGLVYEFPSNPATLTPDPPVFQPSPATANFSWQTTCQRIRNLDYVISFRAEDSLDGVSLVDYDEWKVKVVGPPPEGLVAEQGAENSVQLSWDPYECAAQAETIKIYRKVDTYEFTPGNCELGIPENSDYELIAEVPANRTSYLDTDDDLLYGVNYCYRLVATFNVPDYMESVVSEESCALLEAEIVPLMTNVSVEETSEDNGEIFVRWTSPFGADQVTNPPPYSYELYRGQDFTNMISGGRIQDTTFTDTGLNTLNEQYYYHVIAYDGDFDIVDTSAVASSVRLNLSPLTAALELSWEADVPWTNFAQNFPMHLIYRDNVLPGDPDELVLIDSINVLVDGLNYIDDGSVTGEGSLDDQVEYCYYITTRGTYGNDKIQEPLINNSQIICAMPNDTIPPCEPLSFNIINSHLEGNCEDIVNEICDFNDFENILSWNVSEDDTCGIDVRGYKVYYSSTGNEEDFTEVAQVADTFFIHTGIPSYKGCYRITTIDRSGNESAPTEILCNDNCPFYYLPNIFTPNEDNFNDTFQAYYGSGENTENPYELCPRFVESVKFEVFNRWGTLVYDYDSNSGGENSILIKWDGFSNNGKPVPAGTYYYLATVTFDMLDPSRRQQEYKGWIKIDRGN